MARTGARTSPSRSARKYGETAPHALDACAHECVSCGICVALLTASERRSHYMTLHLSRKWLFASIVVLLIAAPLIYGQGFQTGTLSAVAKDPTGAALPGVTVT